MLVIKNILLRKIVVLTAVLVLLASCSALSGRDGVTLNDRTIVAGKDSKKKKSEVEPATEESSKYDAILPATDFLDEPNEADANLSAQEVRIETTEISAPSSDDSSASASDASSANIKPVLLLDHSYTLRLGLFDSNEQATKFANDSELDVQEAGISEVTIEQQVKYLLAYGVYSSLIQARDAATTLSDKIGDSVTVVSLASIKAIANEGKDDKENNSLITW